MLLATWNVNSLRARLPRVLDWLATRSPDVVALQETKCTEANLPRAELEAAGYEVAHRGFSQWNGVAVLSRIGLADVAVGFPGMPGVGRGSRRPGRSGATCGGVRVWSLYIPNGRVPDSPHYAYKLEWLAALREAGTGWLGTDPAGAVALCGDFNIAPDRRRRLGPGLLRRVHPRDAAGAGPPSPRSSTPGSPTSCDRTPRGPGRTPTGTTSSCGSPHREGMRIDFVLGSPGLASTVTGARIDREARKGKAPSDHAPVLVELAGPTPGAGPDPAAAIPVPAPATADRTAAARPRLATA